MADEAYRLVVAPAARRALTEAPPMGLPLAVSMAVGKFVTGALLDQPHRVGKPLSRELAGCHAARRGSYRIVYRVDDQSRTVHVLRIDHRADVYRV